MICSYLTPGKNHEKRWPQDGGAKRPRLDPKVSRIQGRWQRCSFKSCPRRFFSIREFFSFVHRTTFFDPRIKVGPFPVWCQRTGRKSAVQTNLILPSLIAHRFNCADHLNRQTICQQMFDWDSANKQSKVANWYTQSSWQRNYYSRHIKNLGGKIDRWTYILQRFTS